MNRNRHTPPRSAPALAPLLLLLILPGIAGCQRGVAVPKGWSAVRRDADPAPAARMEILVCYGWKFSAHALVRLTAPGEPPLLWDPGGDYRLGDPGVWRTGCLVLDPVPSAESYWHWRQATQREPLMEVFEFSISPAQWRTIRDALVQGSLPDPAPDAFPAVRRAGTCATSVSDLLICFGSPRIRLTRRYFIPDDLARFLWTQHPNRVHLFTADPPQQVTYAEQNRPSPTIDTAAANIRRTDPADLDDIAPPAGRAGR